MHVGGFHLSKIFIEIMVILTSQPKNYLNLLEKFLMNLVVTTLLL